MCMLQKKAFMITKAVVITFALFVAITIILGDEPIWKKVLSIVVGIAAGWLLFQRDTYLPFLGDAVFPSSMIVDDRTPEGANAEVTVRLAVPDGTKVIFWGAEPSPSIVGNPWDAYAKYTNSGVSTVRGGQATLKFKCPAEYKVMNGAKKLKRHIHYRTCCTRNAMMGPVETVDVSC